MFAVVDVTNNRNIVIEEIEMSRTSFTLYDGAIFIHQGISFLVKERPAKNIMLCHRRTDVNIQQLKEILLSTLLVRSCEGEWY